MTPLYHQLMMELKNLRNDKTLSDSDSTQTKQLSSRSSPPVKYQYLIAVACTAALTAFHYGYAISSTNVPAKVFTSCSTSKSTPTFFGCFKVSKSAWGLVGMGLPLGGWIGGSLAPTIINKCGSLKLAILFLNIPLIMAYLFMALAVNLSMLVIGRCLLGFASGASGMMIPLYLSSVSPLPSRGIFTNFFQLFLCSGLFIAEIISYAADLGSHSWHWRFSFGSGLIIVALQYFLAKVCNLLPHTPRDLDSMNRPQESAQLRTKLGINDDSDSSDSTSLLLLKDSGSSVPEVPIASQGGLLDLITFRIKAARKSLALGIILHAGQQISGVNAIFFYSALIVGDKPWTPVVLAFINLGMTPVAIGLLQYTGRRPITLFSVAGSTASLMALSSSFLLYPAIAPFFLVSFVFCFAVGLGPVPWMITPEIFPSSWQLTPAAISICVSANWITNIAVTGFFPLLDQHFKKEWIFFTFAVFSTLLLVYISHFLPETRNRPSNFI